MNKNSYLFKKAHLLDAERGARNIIFHEYACELNQLFRTYTKNPNIRTITCISHVANKQECNHVLFYDLYDSDDDNDGICEQCGKFVQNLRKKRPIIYTKKKYGTKFHNIL